MIGPIQKIQHRKWLRFKGTEKKLFLNPFSKKPAENYEQFVFFDNPCEKIDAKKNTSRRIISLFDGGYYVKFSGYDAAEFIIQETLFKGKQYKMVPKADISKNWSVGDIILIPITTYDDNLSGSTVSYYGIINSITTDNKVVVHFNVPSGSIKKTENVEHIKKQIYKYDTNINVLESLTSGKLFSYSKYYSDISEKKMPLIFVGIQKISDNDLNKFVIGNGDTSVGDAIRTGLGELYNDLFKQKMFDKDCYFVFENGGETYYLKSEHYYFQGEPMEGKMFTFELSLDPNIATGSVVMPLPIPTQQSPRSDLKDNGALFPPPPPPRSVAVAASAPIVESVATSVPPVAAQVKYIMHNLSAKTKYIVTSEHRNDEEDGKFYYIVSLLHSKVDETPGDGQCFIHALAGKKKENETEIRNRILENIDKYREVFKEETYNKIDWTNRERLNFNTWFETKKELIKNGGIADSIYWSDEADLALVAEIFPGKNIIILDESSAEHNIRVVDNTNILRKYHRDDTINDFFNSTIFVQFTGVHFSFINLESVDTEKKKTIFEGIKHFLFRLVGQTEVGHQGGKRSKTKKMRKKMKNIRKRTLKYRKGRKDKKRKN